MKNMWILNLAIWITGLGSLSAFFLGTSMFWRRRYRMLTLIQKYNGERRFAVVIYPWISIRILWNDPRMPSEFVREWEVAGLNRWPSVMFWLFAASIVLLFVAQRLIRF